MAAAPSLVPADREEAFVCSAGGTVNNIGWHGLECDIIVCFFFNSDWVKMRHTERSLFVCAFIMHVATKALSIFIMLRVLPQTVYSLMSTPTRIVTPFLHVEHSH